MRVADFICQYLVDYGVRHIFMVTGGGAMHLNDAIKSSELTFICNHHEQASAMAAESYARVTNELGVINVTTGPGGINALNGVFGAWTDSLPLLVVSGQVKTSTIVSTHPECKALRQLGDQEAPMIEMATPVTKYAALIRDPNQIKYELQKAIHLATTSRPGPVWLDIPIDVQGAQINPDVLPSYEPDGAPSVNLAMDRVVSLLKSAKRPVLFGGAGVRISGAVDVFRDVAQQLGIPTVTAWNAHDIMPDAHPCYCGRPGTIGTRGGNFVTQNADVLLVVGSRLNIRQISYNWECFARNATIVHVDIDPAELAKPTLCTDVKIEADVCVFLTALLAENVDVSYTDWLAWARKINQRYTIISEKQCLESQINPYKFMQKLSDQLKDDDVVACGDGAACVMSFQTIEIKENMRLYTNSGSASMGYDIPAAIGAAIARDGKRVVCLAGDGSAQMNIQELQTIVHLNLPIVIFIINNGGYLSIRQTQESHFSGNMIGESPASGVSFPEYATLAQAFGIPSNRVTTDSELEAAISEALSSRGPFLCEVIVDPAEPMGPKLSSRRLDDGSMVSSPLEDMSPFLDRDELADVMSISDG